MKKESSARVFASWSGGKDGCLAAYRAMKQGMDVRYLANMVSEDGRRSRSHGIKAEVIKKQAEAIGIPIAQQPTADDNYEARFIEMIEGFKRQGVTGGVFGDIDFNAHREWIERVSNKAGVTPYLPLWLEDQEKLLNEFIGAGFKSIVIAVKAELFGQEILGRVVDRKFMDFLKGMGKGVTVCGEAGEYHTLVLDGPIFKKRLVITGSEKVTRGEHHFLEITGTELKTK